MAAGATIQLFPKEADSITSLCILRGWFLNPRAIGAVVTESNCLVFLGNIALAIAGREFESQIPQKPEIDS